jgi:hypothetical protein
LFTRRHGADFAGQSIGELLGGDFDGDVAPIRGSRARYTAPHTAGGEKGDDLVRTHTLARSNTTGFVIS